MVRVALCGIATSRNFNKNGEARIVEMLSSSLRSEGHDVACFSIADSLKLPLGISKMTFDGHYAYDYYSSRLKDFGPQVCVNFTDFDFSAIRAEKDLGAKVVLSVNMHHLACPLGTAFDWNSEYCTKSSIHRCGYHIVRSFNNQLITGPLDPISGRLYNTFALFNFLSTRSLLEMVDLFVVPSSGISEELVALGIGAEKIRLIRNGVDTKKWAPSKGAAVSKPKKILYYSFPSFEKGADFFVELAKMFNNNYADVRFVMRKSDKYPNVPPNVDLLPFWIDPKDMPRIVADSYLVVIPSIWEDPSPFVCSEAMSAGKPVVAFDVMGTREQVKDGETGFLTKVGDIAGLYSKTKEIIDNEGLASKMGSNGRKRIQKLFSLKNTSHQYIETIMGLIRG